MKFIVYQIDAWLEPDKSWRYNNSIEVGTVEINGEPTTRRILKAMRDAGYITKPGFHEVDDYFSCDSTWVVQEIRNGRPVFDLVGVK